MRALHFALAFFATLASAPITHVPFKGAGPAVAAALAVSARARLAALPDVPTLGELGYTGGAVA